METLIPKEEQISAMLDGRIYQLLREKIPDFHEVDFRKYLTVTGKDIEEFLVRHPDSVERYLAEHLGRAPIHDTGAIEVHGSTFNVGWVDHGRLRFGKQFPSANEAVAEHVLLNHGITRASRCSD
jgi:hypothetical protein